jgi:hypothetical protein
MPKGKAKSNTYFVAPTPPVGVVACPDIHEDETIQSVLWRFSRANGVTILAAARALGLAYPGGPVSPAYPIRPHASAPADLVHHLRGAFLRDHADRGFRVMANDSMRTLAHRELVRGGDSLVCPHCLAEPPGYWRVSWKFAFVFACPKHRCLLSETCPDCSQGHGKGKKDRSVVPPHSEEIGSTVTCMNTARMGSPNARAKRPCGRDLRTIQVPQVADLTRSIHEWLPGAGFRGVVARVEVGSWRSVPPGGLSRVGVSASGAPGGISGSSWRASPAGNSLPGSGS